MGNKLFRIIDANINRAMEGIRVVEDIVRFELNDEIITSMLKNLRSDLKKATSQLGVSSYELLAARSSRKDVGADLYSEGESERAGLNEIITSNFKRIEESLRVLEESVKLLGPKFGKVFKALRYRVYALEQDISAYRLPACPAGRPLSAVRFPAPCLYVIVDPEHSLGRSAEKVAKEAISGGAKIIQLRDKRTSKIKFLREAKKIAKICRRAGVTFIINDHADIARIVDADGVHLGQDDIPIAWGRQILGGDKIVGASASNLVQALKAEKDGADYVGVGPVYSTSVKISERPVGLKVLKQIQRRVKIPVIAIGGINLSNIRDIKKTGVARVAVIRAAMCSSDTASAVRKLRGLMRK